MRVTARAAHPTCKFRVFALALLAVGATAGSVSAQCTNLTTSTQTVVGVPEAHLTSLHKAYSRISAAAELRPSLWICISEVVNAAAIYDDDEQHAVMVTTGMLRVLDADLTEVAAVLGHEFGHLLARHGIKHREFAVDSADEVIRDAQQRLSQGANRKIVVANAQKMFAAKLAAFSRSAEREADDHGFSLTATAGFDPSGARKAGERMRAVQGGNQQGWLATHPGWDERVGYSARLEGSEAYRRDAERLLALKQSDALASLVAQWMKAFPESGAAFYYQGMVSLLTRESPEKTSEAFETAVLNFSGEGFSRAAQAYQGESYTVTIALCVSLYREARKVQALHCLKRLQTDEEVELFRQITGWRDFLLINRKESMPRRPLYAARGDQGQLIVSNCAHIANRGGLSEVKSWRGVRKGPLPKQLGGDALVCSPDFCDCRPIKLDSAFPNLRLPTELR